MRSVREVFACLKLGALIEPSSLPWPGDLSVRLDVLGYTEGPQFTNLSLLEHWGWFQNPGVNLNLIRVGSDAFTAADTQEINTALLRLRGIYGKNSLGIGRVEHFAIPASMTKHEDVDDDSEAEDLTNEWTVHNDGVDCFLVKGAWAEDSIMRAGLSEVDGPCNKDDDGDMTGTVVVMQNLALLTAVALGHEIGHYLGLGHIDDLDAEDVLEGDFTEDQAKNLMFPANIGGSALNSEQRACMREHCMMLTGC